MVTPGGRIEQEVVVVERCYSAAACITGLFACVAPVTGGQPEPVADSPFGVCCPWPGVEAAGVKWCRVGAGATVFVTGMRWAELDIAPASRTTAAPAAPKTKLSHVWLSVLPPATTARPCLLLAGHNELPLRVHNDGRRRCQGELKIELTGQRGLLASGRISFDIAAGTTQTVVWGAALPPRNELAGQLARLHISGVADAEPLVPIDLPVRLVRSKAIEFAANSFVEQQYLHKAEKSGCAESIRFGSEFGYRFDLRNMRLAHLQINVGANGANPWSVSVSMDGKTYLLERSGKSWPSWQTISLDKYLIGPSEIARPVFVKIQGTDCQVREVVLEAEAYGGLRPAK